MDSMATGEKIFQKQVSKPKVRAPLRRVRLWTRLSPAHLLRVFVDNYVKGCVNFANDSEADAHPSFRVTLSYDDNGAFTSASHPRHVEGVVSAGEVNLDQSKYGYQGSVQGESAAERGSVLAGSVHLVHKHHTIITGCHGLSMPDRQGQSSPLHKVDASGLAMADIRGSVSGTLRVSSPNRFASRQHTDIDVSKAGCDLEALFQTSMLHPTEFLQSATRRGAAFGNHQLGHVKPRGGSGRILRRPRSRSASSTSVSPIAMPSRPLTPVTDISTFQEQSRRRKPSRRSLSRPSSTLAVRRPIPPFRDFYDNRSAPPPTAASPQPFLDAMYIKI
ncbi:hypothetical protein M758_10G121300 [Ceratodon purpureus]|nr:hypothetical protein M758_10G121300 [Ceratodon purpureus]